MNGDTDASLSTDTDVYMVSKHLTATSFQMFVVRYWSEKNIYHPGNVLKVFIISTTVNGAVVAAPPLAVCVVTGGDNFMTRHDEMILLFDYLLTVLHLWTNLVYFTLSIPSSLHGHVFCIDFKNACTLSIKSKVIYNCIM